MPLVSVMMAWAIETPGVSTPPTVVKAPYLSTSLRLRGLNARAARAMGASLVWVIGRIAVEPTRGMADAFPRT